MLLDFDDLDLIPRTKGRIALKIAYLHHIFRVDGFKPNLHRYIRVKENNYFSFSDLDFILSHMRSKSVTKYLVCTISSKWMVDLSQICTFII